MYTNVVSYTTLRTSALISFNNDTLIMAVIPFNNGRFKRASRKGGHGKGRLNVLSYVTMYT